MKIEQTLSPDQKDIDFLREMIDAENPDKDAVYPIGFFIRDDKGKIVAGCNCFILFGVIYTDQLWVHKNYRKQGLGTQLLEQVHDHGRKVGCTMATVATMSFQKALGFYEGLGYVSDLTREGCVDGSKCIFLKKIL